MWIKPLFQIAQCTRLVQFAQLAQFITLVSVRGSTLALLSARKECAAVLVGRKLRSPTTNLAQLARCARRTYLVQNGIARAARLSSLRVDV